MGPRPVTSYVTRRFMTGPAVEEETPPTTSEAGLETSAAIADRIDQGRLVLPKKDVADYLVNQFLCEILLEYFSSFTSTIFVHNQVVVNMLYHEC